jgi:hypothetical protein
MKQNRNYDSSIGIATGHGTDGWELIPDSDKNIFIVRFEIFTAVTTKNAVFWDVTPCGS